MSLILYTEDDAILLADGDAVLRDAGYEVLLASTGAEACALLGSQGARVSALVTDINLAGEMQGWSVAEAGREINPDLPVVYVSASDRREFARRGVADSVWIPKPFQWSRVIEALAALLRDHAPDRGRIEGGYLLSYAGPP